MSENPRIVYVCAPQGAGKTRHAEALREMFGCSCIVDEWDGISEVPDGALVLTNRRIIRVYVDGIDSTSEGLMFAPAVQAERAA